MGEKRNWTGTSYALTVFTPILKGHEEQVRVAIESLPKGEASPLARLAGLHFSRLQIVDHLKHQGGNQKPETLKQAWLVFTGSLDGPLDRFLDEICEKLPAEADSWWSHCVGYPGTSDRAAFKRYMKHNQIHTSMFGASHPSESVAAVKDALALRERVLDFAIAAQGLEAPELQAKFNKEFANLS